MLKKRLAEATVETPEEKYLRFIKEEPLLLQRIPLYHVAAYLAMTPETLSRIRKKITENNFLFQIKEFAVSSR